MLVKIFQDEVKLAVVEFLQRRGIATTANEIRFYAGDLPAAAVFATVSNVSLEPTAGPSDGPYR